MQQSVSLQAWPGRLAAEDSPPVRLQAEGLSFPASKNACPAPEKQQPLFPDDHISIKNELGLGLITAGREKKYVNLLQLPYCAAELWRLQQYFLRDYVIESTLDSVTRRGTVRVTAKKSLSGPRAARCYQRLMPMLKSLDDRSGRLEALDRPGANTAAKASCRRRSAAAAGKSKTTAPLGGAGIELADTSRGQPPLSLGGDSVSVGAAADADAESARRRLLFALRCLELYEANIHVRQELPVALQRMVEAENGVGCLDSLDDVEVQEVAEVVELDPNDEPEVIDLEALVVIVETYTPLAGNTLVPSPGVVKTEPADV